MMGTMRIGADVGGTFTDVVLEIGGDLDDDGSGGQMFSTKVLTTYEAPEQGILEGVATVVAEAGADLTELDTFIHGTTLATNALIGRTGARTALVTTDGFRDTIEMRTESRFEQYDLNLVLPTPLIERRDRHVLSERIAADGTVLRPFDEDEACALIEVLAGQTAAEAYEAIAVGFIHAYVDGSHERRFRDLLVEHLPNVPVSISSEVAPQMREFERFNTVCANAYVQPLIATYLRRLEAQLLETGASCPVYLIHSGGGLINVDAAARFPVRLIESGPAGGAIFAADIAARHGLDQALSYDMGGTTAKICLIEDQTPRTAKTFEVARTHRFTKGSGMPISIPVIEMIEIGAGGGSIATVDVLGQIRVGPLSAGSEPGPAAYGLGGTKPTVSDANLVLGRLSADSFGAPGVNLDDAAARDALDRTVGAVLAMDAETAAAGVVEVVDENMANAARVHAIENGKDVATFTMIAFGGGAPLHAGRLCEKLDVIELLVPPGAGVGSAIGFLRAPFAYEALRSHHATVDHFDPDAVNRMLVDLAEEATAFVAEALASTGTPVTDVALETERWVYMRYAGQGWEIPVLVDATPFDALGGERLADQFEKAYEEFFGRAIAGLAVEAIGWSVRVSTPRPPVSRVTRVVALRDIVPDRTRLIHDTATDTSLEAGIVERHALVAGDRVLGPAVIVETQTTTLLSSRQQAIMQTDGCLLVTRTTPVSKEANP
ncbi:MAG: hydantoinase/oxoprolinase family protein [Acidimicrobiales bacterium]|nr:hydantoinase/oxoprolinase family protein [Acidimicrobiales bacterium]